jgi:WD40 repeat protein
MRPVCLALVLSAGLCPLRAADSPILVLNTGGHTAPVAHVFFRKQAGQTQVVSTSADNTVRVWDPVTGESIQTLRLPVTHEVWRARNAGILAAALSPDGRLLAVGCHGRSPGEHGVFLLDLDGNRIVRYQKSPTGIVFGLAFSPDGRWLASCGDRVLRVWEAATGEERRRLAGHEADTQAVAFSPDGTLLASAGSDRTVRLWSLASGKRTAVIDEPAAVVGLAWSGDGKTLALFTADNVVRLCDPAGKDRGRYNRGTTGATRVSLAFSADSGRLLVGPALLDLESGKVTARCAGAGDVFRCSALSPDGKTAVFGGQDGSDLFLWDTADGKVVHRLAGSGRTIDQVGWSPDGKALSWHWSAPGPGHRRQKTAPQSFELAGLKFGPTPDRTYRRAVPVLGDLSLVRAGSGRVEVRRGEDVLRLLEPTRPGQALSCFTFLGEDRAVTGGDFGLDLYDIRTGKPGLAAYRGSGEVLSVAPSPDNRFFLSGGTAQALRVWNTERDAPLLSLFVGGSDWIAWTPEGYYAASAGGERLMGWQVDNGSERFPSFYPAARFRPSLYRPDAISRLLTSEAGGSIARALELADRDRGTKTSVVEVAEVLPPRVSIAAPAVSGLVVRETRLAVKATVESVGKHPVTAVQLLLDGRPYDKPVPVGKLGTAELTWTVELTPGKHRLSALARSATAETVEVACEPPAAPPANAPALYVLAIGIEAYEGDWKLDCPCNDARELVKSFETNSRPLFRPVESRLVLDKEATRAGILAGLAWLKEKMKPADLGVIFYAGHGYTDDDGLFYLLSIDTDADRLKETAVTGDDLKKRLADLPGRILLLLDACHSAPADSVRFKRHRGTADVLVRDLADEEVGVIVLVSAQGPEEAKESAEKKHGYFTQALLDGLSGKADYNKDGLIHLTELDLYVEDQVAQWSKDTQHPAIGKPATIRSFPLARP